MGMTDAANQAVWYQGFLSELGYSVEDLIPIHADNKGAVDLVLNPVMRCRSKHIDIKHHVICEYIEEKKISLIHMLTTEMTADRFTKSLSCTLLLCFNLCMGLITA